MDLIINLCFAADTFYTLWKHTEPEQADIEITNNWLLTKPSHCKEKKKSVDGFSLSSTIHAGKYFRKQKRSENSNSFMVTAVWELHVCESLRNP